MILSNNQRLVVSSNYRNIILIERLLNDVVELFDINKKISDRIWLALTEAFNNALEHGNKRNPDKHVEITFRAEKEKLLFTIKDEGPGFDHTRLPDPTDAAHIQNPSGRGVFLMKRLSSNVYYEDNGSKVVLEFEPKK